MRWRFTLYDRNNSPTVIEEPVGWDDNSIELKRDTEWHGIFLSIQGDTLEFYDEAMEIIKNEYELYGSQGNIVLELEEDCGQGYEVFSRSKLDFLKYEYYCGDKCYVKIPAERTGDTVDLRDRINQKVNLESLKAFDETTDLVPYAKLAFPILLPSKGIFIQDSFLNDADNGTPVQGVPLNNAFPSNNSTVPNTEYGMLELAFNKQVATEIGNAGTNLQPLYTCTLTNAGTLGCASLNRFTMSGSIGANTALIAPLDISSIVNFQEETPNYNSLSNPCKLSINIFGSLTNVSCSQITLWFVVAVLPTGRSGMLDSDYVYIYQSNVFPNANVSIGQVISLNASYSDDNFILNKGDRVFCFYATYHTRLNSNNVNNVSAFLVNYAPNSIFKLTNLSKTPATASKVFAVNESFSRIAESISNNKLRAYSEYFGRIDSEPYSVPADGCGALQVVTDGLRIRRQENKIPDKTNVFALSLQDMFDGLNPIHNIGMGLEPDPFRSGNNLIRIEPWHYFYNNEVIHSCTKINKITRKVNDKEIYSTFQFGYAKWEAEEYTGLDEFLTKRIARTQLSGVKNELSKLSKFIGSGYALEITRRKGNDDSKDWRYDKDTFVICCNRIPKFSVTFNPVNSSYQLISFLYTGDISVFDGITSIQVANSVSNNGLFTIDTSVTTEQSPGVYLVEISVVGGVLVAETSSGVTFPSISFAGNSIFAELGNITNANNVIDPTTLYNYPISPIRNAMRWMNKILQSYRQFNNDAKLIFTDGDGNYFAEGELLNALCKLESGVLAENATLTPANFNNTDDAKPFLLPERIVFDYPLNSIEYKNIERNPYGKIYFQNDCEEGYGFIDDIIYSPYDGLATFILIPEI